jgi:hypothetical protein
VEAKKDRVTAIFSTVFKDDDDVVIGKLFMQVDQFAYFVQKLRDLIGVKFATVPLY